MLETLFGTTLGTLIVLFLVVLAILWTVLPFAVFGIKPLLREVLAELRALNRDETASADPQDEAEPSGLSEAFPTFSKMLPRMKP